MNELEQLRFDLMWLARRQKALEDATSEWSEFMTVELLKNGIQLHKHKISDGYFKNSLKDKFKADYEKFESLFSTIHTYFDKKKDTYKKYLP